MRATRPTGQWGGHYPTRTVAPGSRGVKLLPLSPPHPLESREAVRHGGGNRAWPTVTWPRKTEPRYDLALEPRGHTRDLLIPSLVLGSCVPQVSSAQGAYQESFRSSELRVPSSPRQLQRRVDVHLIRPNAQRRGCEVVVVLATRNAEVGVDVFGRQNDGPGFHPSSGGHRDGRRAQAARPIPVAENRG